MLNFKIHKVNSHMIFFYEYQFKLSTKFLIVAGTIMLFSVRAYATEPIVDN
mgnify:CR=1 FL=1